MAKIEVKVDIVIHNIIRCFLLLLKTFAILLGRIKKALTSSTHTIFIALPIIIHNITRYKTEDILRG